MQRCKQCDSPLAKIDTACVNCGESVLPVKTKADFRQHFGKLVTILFVISAVMSVVALFTNYVGSFITCMAVTLVLLMVKKSADEMSSTPK
jgi:hypothetical protein